MHSASLRSSFLAPFLLLDLFPCRHLLCWYKMKFSNTTTVESSRMFYYQDKIISYQRNLYPGLTASLGWSLESLGDTLLRTYHPTADQDVRSLPLLFSLLSSFLSLGLLRNGFFSRAHSHACTKRLCLWLSRGRCLLSRDVQSVVDVLSSSPYTFVCLCIQLRCLTQEERVAHER